MIPRHSQTVLIRLWNTREKINSLNRSLDVANEDTISAIVVDLKPRINLNSPTPLWTQIESQRCDMRTQTAFRQVPTSYSVRVKICGRLSK